MLLHVSRLLGFWTSLISFCSFSLFYSNLIVAGNYTRGVGRVTVFEKLYLRFDVYFIGVIESDYYYFRLNPGEIPVFLEAIAADLPCKRYSELV